MATYVTIPVVENVSIDTTKDAVVIDGVMFSTLNVGLAWPNPDAAVDDAKAAIDRLTKSDARSRSEDRPANICGPVRILLTGMGSGG